MPFSLHGVKVPHKKNTADKSAEKMPVPQSVTIPMAMHIGAPANVAVKVGDTVKVGTLVGEQNGFVSAPVYSSVSGKVTKIIDMRLSNGKFAPAVTIESDGDQTLDENLSAPQINSKEDLLEAIRASGVVGLGGAGFPTHVKFATDKKIEVLVVNGAECEPYITSDSLTMAEKSEEIGFIIDLLVEYFDIDKVCIGIEKNKPTAIAKMQEMAKSRAKVTVMPLPSIYPQGGEKVLVYHTCGKVIPTGKLPIDVGCVVSNCTSLYKIAEFIQTGMPLVEKCVTVDGDCVKEPKNVLVPVGTALKDVFDFCGGFKTEPLKVIYGGPMMGITVPSLDVPVLKQTNAIIALSAKESPVIKPTACIRCGTCINNCPFGISAPEVVKGFNNNDMDFLITTGVMSCMECGCCAFNCPAHRPLIQTNKMAKTALAEHLKKEAKK